MFAGYHTLYAELQAQEKNILQQTGNAYAKTMSFVRLKIQRSYGRVVQVIFCYLYLAGGERL